MNRYVKNITGILLLVYLLAGIANGQSTENIRDLYLAGKKMCVLGDWTGAVNQFEALLENHPKSKYEDDARFWIGYCLEKIPGQKDAAFRNFDQLVRMFPTSPWSDDAEVHQIELAEAFVYEGRVVYKQFLFDALKKDQEDIQFRAALALGRLGEKGALPVLAKMEKNEAYGLQARDLISLLQIERMAPDKSGSHANGKDHLDITYFTPPTADEADRGEILWFNTQRYNQYRKMLRKDDNWSEAELLTFGLWHILPGDDFEVYRLLSSAYDKQEWLRKFWKSNDPTPTSPQNEFEDEFRRRVKYARSQFSGFWNYANFKYLTDQHLRLGWPHAPWDARGELYIKYGNPDSRSDRGWQTEHWTYFRYNVDFLVKQYMTNIYGNAIHAGEMSVKLYSPNSDKSNIFEHLNPLSSNKQYEAGSWASTDSYLQASFIFNNEMRYVFDYKAKPIKNLKLMVEEKNNNGNRRLTVRYQLPVKEFEMVSAMPDYEIRYREVYSVLDGDLREVTHNDIIRRIGKIPDPEFLIGENIYLDLPRGRFTLYLRIEDMNGANLGIFSQDLSN